MATPVHLGPLIVYEQNIDLSASVSAPAGLKLTGRDLITSLNKKSWLVNSQRKACGHEGEPSETTHVRDAIFAQSPSEMYG